MAKPLSVKEKLEAARRGGPVKPPGEAKPTTAPATEPKPKPTPTPAPTGAQPAPGPVLSASAGRPLTVKEKLAAARAGGTPSAAAKPASPAKPAPVKAKAEPVKTAAKTAAPGLTLKEKLEAAKPGSVPKASPPKPALAATSSRPLSVKDKLAAARAGGAVVPVKPVATPAPTSVPTPPSSSAPLDELTDPAELADALRTLGARKTKEAEAGASPKVKPVKLEPAKPAGLDSAMVLLKVFGVLLIGGLTFLVAAGLLTMMLGRTIFPEIPSARPSETKDGAAGEFGFRWNWNASSSV